MTFIDDYTRFIRVYLLRNNDEAFDMFLSYKAKVENQLDRKIRIRSDRGGEYILLNDYCEKEGTIHEVTPSYSPESNGVGERKNKTLKKMMNSLLVSASLLIICGAKLYCLHVIYIIEFHTRKLVGHLMSYGKVMHLT